MSTEIISEITLDVTGNTSPYVTLRAKQGDNMTRFVIAKIVCNGEPIEIDTSDTAFVNFKRIGDDKSRTYVANFTEDGRIKFAIPSWALALANSVRCDITIVGAASEDEEAPRLTTLDFFIRVEASASALSESDIGSDEDGIYLLSLIANAEKSANEADESAEVAKQAADQVMAFYATSAVFVGSLSEYSVAYSSGKIKTGTIVVILDDDENVSTTAVLGKAILGKMMLGTK